MNPPIEEPDDRHIFGVPAILTSSETASLQRDLTLLWRTIYGQAPDALQADLDRTRLFFDPLARGHTLRDRLSRLEPLPSEVTSRLEKYGEPLVVVAGAGVLLAGVEARLILALLADASPERPYMVLSEESASWAERTAMTLYRTRNLTRLKQVIDLRAGAGAEVMQAVAVGLVLALLINRSDSPERSVTQWDRGTPTDKDVDIALYSSAERFAEIISGRRGRSSTEHRLKGGYALTEARRRLAHRLAVTPDSHTGGALLYVREEYRDEIIRFLARDLARRSALTSKTLEDGFDQLVTEFRSSARTLAYRSMVFEQPGTTLELRRELLHLFAEARSASDLISGNNLKNGGYGTEGY